jgi:hypothetical protein
MLHSTPRNAAAARPRLSPSWALAPLPCCSISSSMPEHVKIAVAIVAGDYGIPPSAQQSRRSRRVSTPSGSQAEHFRATCDERHDRPSIERAVVGQANSDPWRDVAGPIARFVSISFQSTAPRARTTRIARGDCRDAPQRCMHSKGGDGCFVICSLNLGKARVNGRARTRGEKCRSANSGSGGASRSRPEEAHDHPSGVTHRHGSVLRRRINASERGQRCRPSTPMKTFEQSRRKTSS